MIVMVRLLVGWAVLSTAAWSVSAVAPALNDDQAAAAPNILLIISDDHSGAHLGSEGDPNIKTPRLDQLASEGMRFRRMYVSASQCVPSRAALMTGRSPVAIQMTRFSAPLPADVASFPEWLRARGYFTGICGRSFHLDGSANANSAPETDEILKRHQLRTFANRVDWLSNAPFRREAIPDLVRTYLKMIPAGKPFFLQVGFSDPHRPYDDNASATRPDPSTLKLPAHFPDTPLIREDHAAYLGEIQRLDGDVGRVLDVLEENQLARSTVVVFVGDNGSAQLRGKGTLHEFGIRVPLIVRWPGVVKPASVTDELISGEDLAPTFAEIAGAPVPRQVTGKSFLKRLRGESFEPRQFVFAERGAHGSSLPNNTAAFDLARVVVTPTHKLIYNALPALPYAPIDFNTHPLWNDLKARHQAGTLGEPFERLYFPPSRSMFELYDLRSDPSELQNLAGLPAHAVVEHDLKVRLQEWMILERDFLPLPIPPRQPAGQGVGKTKSKSKAKTKANLKEPEKSKGS